MFDPNAKDVNGATNIERMRSGKALIGYDNEPANLHHLIGREPDTIAEVGGKLHSDETAILHIPQYEKVNGKWIKRKNYSFRSHNGRKSGWPKTKSGKIKQTTTEKIFKRSSSDYWKNRAEEF